MGATHSPRIHIQEHSKRLINEFTLLFSNRKPIIMAIVNGFHRNLLMFMSPSSDVTSQFVIFYSRRPPPIGIPAYLDHLAYYLEVSDEIVALACCYISRFLRKNKNFALTPNTIHKVLLGSITAASKQVKNFRLSNSLISRIGGVKLDELNQIETCFLKGISWELQCSSLEHWLGILLEDSSTDDFSCSSEFIGEGTENETFSELSVFFS